MLRPLDQIKLPNLVSNDADDIEQEVIDRITSDPNWDANWDGELFQNSYQMLLKTFTYLYGRNAKASNNRLKERFLNRALSPQAIYDNLTDMRIQLIQAKGSSTTIQADLVDTILTVPIIIPKFQQLTGTGRNSETITFEFIKKDNDGKFNYFDNIIIIPTV